MDPHILLATRESKMSSREKAFHYWRGMVDAALSRKGLSPMSESYAWNLFSDGLSVEEVLNELMYGQS